MKPTNEEKRVAENDKKYNDIENRLFSNPKNILDPILMSKHSLMDNTATLAKRNKIISDDIISRELGIDDINNPFSDAPMHSSNEVLIENKIENDKKTLSHIEELKFRRDNFWKSCCSLIIDKRATVFFTQVGVGTTVIIFSMVKLSTSSGYECTGDDPSIFIGLISLVLGWFVPSPTMS